MHSKLSTSNSAPKKMRTPKGQSKSWNKDTSASNKTQEAKLAMDSKLDSVLHAIRGMQAEINELKTTSAHKPCNDAAQMMPLQLPQFLSGTQPLGPPNCNTQQNSSGSSEVLQAMKLMAAMTYMTSVHYVGNFFC